MSAGSSGAHPLTYLYVPGNRPERFDRAVASGADAIVLDLEDAVPASAKSTARQEVSQWLAQRSATEVPAWVRVNSGVHLTADLSAVVPAGADGIWLPKCEGLEQLVAVGTLLSDLEQTHGLEQIPLSPLIETATGLRNVRELAAADRVAYLQLGEVDLAADLGIRPSVDGRELLWARSQVVAASVAAGIAPPLGPASPEIRDTAAFAASTEQIERLGFEGRACIHPSQIPTVLEAFAPSNDDIDAAVNILAALSASDGAAVTGVDGSLIDEAVARNARRTMARVRQAAAR